MYSGIMGIPYAYPQTQELQQFQVSEITISEAIEEFLVARSMNLSHHTIRDYSLSLHRLFDFLPDDMPVSEVIHRDIRQFLASYPGSNKNKLNAYIGLSSFWTWCIMEGYCLDHIVRRVEKPKPEKKVIVPLERQELESLLAATRDSKNVQRDTAIIKILADTGVRASELCEARIADLSGNQLKVFGKGSKERRVPMTESVIASIDDYLTARKSRPGDSLFSSIRDEQLTRSGLGSLLERTGERAGVIGCHPHRFRHTFAINYLRNGGDPYTLQMILGHATMEMVKRYLALSERDVSARHFIASPILNWEL